MGKAGETFVETLFSMVVISMAMLILLGAVFTAARVSRRTEQALNPRDFDALDDSVTFYVQLENLNDHSSVKIPITVTEQYNGNFYYEKGK